MRPGIKQVLLGLILLTMIGSANADLVNQVTIGYNIDFNDLNPYLFGVELTTGLPGLIVWNEYPDDNRYIPDTNQVYFNTTIAYKDLFREPDYIVINVYDSDGDLYKNKTVDVNNPPPGVSYPNFGGAEHSYPQNISLDLGNMTIADGDYEYNIYVISNLAGYDYIATPNTSFSVISPTVTPDDLGSCVTYQGYSYIYVRDTGEELVSFDLSDSPYVEADLTNVNATVQAWSDGDYTIVLNVSQNATPIIWIGDSSYEFVYQAFSFSTDKDLVIPAANMTFQNPTYKISLFNENTGGILDVTDHLPDTLNLVDGVLESGNIRSLDYIDGDRYNITETAALVPDFIVNFTDVPAVNGIVQVQTRYEGNPAHEVEIQLYDFGLDAWSSQTIITEGAALQDYNITLVPANFTQNGLVRVRLQHTSSGASGHFLETEMIRVHTDAAEMELTVLCDNHAPDTLDLTSEPNPFTLTAFEKPKLVFKYDGDERIYEQAVSMDTDLETFHLTPGDTISEIDFSIVDYVGGFADGYLQIYREVNNSLELIWMEKWENTQVLDVDLKNDTYYQFVLWTPTESRVISWKQTQASESIVLTINQALFQDKVDFYDGVDLGFTSSYSASTVGVAWDIDESLAGEFQNITFRVYNMVDSVYVNIYNQTVVGGGNTGSITHAVSDNNASYPVEAILYVSGYSDGISAADIITLNTRTQQPPYVDGFGFPDEIMGLDRQDLYTGASVILISLVGMAFTFVSVGIGGLATAGAIGVTYYWGWFADMTNGLYLFIVTMAIAYAFVERRKPTQ